MSNLVEIKELGKCYGKKKVMNNLSLSLESGRIVGILGPNGSGKSTLIKMMAGVLKPTSGQIIINGYPVGVNTKKIVSYLPERTYLNPSMKVKEAVDYFADFYEDFSKHTFLIISCPGICTAISGFGQSWNSRLSSIRTKTLRSGCSG